MWLIPIDANQIDKPRYVLTKNNTTKSYEAILNDDTCNRDNIPVKDTISHDHLNSYDRFEIFLLLDGNYYPGTIKSSTRISQTKLYDDGDKETFNVSNEIWSQPDSLLSLSFFTGTHLVRNEKSLLSSILENIGNKTLIWFKTQRFQKPVLIKT